MRSSWTSISSGVWIRVSQQMDHHRSETREFGFLTRKRGHLASGVKNLQAILRYRDRSSRGARCKSRHDIAEVQRDFRSRFR